VREIVQVADVVALELESRAVLAETVEDLLDIGEGVSEDIARLASRYGRSHSLSKRA
jgi:hypothetical protein